MEVPNEIKDIHDAYRKELLVRQRENSSNFDRLVLSLSAAIVGLSISFLNNVFTIKNANCLILLKMSWGALSLVIISTITSFLVSQKALDMQIKFAERYYLKGDEEYGIKRSFLASLTDFLNIFTGIIFIIGIILLIIFVNQNI